MHDLDPVDRAEFAAEISPILALVAPTGMDQAERKIWLAAAYKALDGIPITLLRRGARAAMETADHPSRIVPIIAADVRDEWGWRKRNRAPRSSEVAAARTLDRKDDGYCTPAEAATICRKFGIGQHAVTRMVNPARLAPAGHVPDAARTSRPPIRADYIRMGVDPAVLDKLGMGDGVDDGVA